MDFFQQMDYDDDGWNGDTSEFIFDSPQPQQSNLPSSSNTVNIASPEPPGDSPSTFNHTQSLSPNAAATIGNPSHAQPTTNQEQSSASASSSFSSSSGSAVPGHQQASSAASPRDTRTVGSAQAGATGGDAFSNSTESENGGHTLRNNDEIQYQAVNPVNPDIDSLSISNSDFGFGSAAPLNASIAAMFDSKENSEYANATYGDINTGSNQVLDSSPQQMTVAPSKMFSLDSREESPNDTMMTVDNSSNDSTPFNMNTYSPMTGNVSTFNPTTGHDAFNANAMSMQGLSGFGNTIHNNGKQSLSEKISAQCDKWPYRLSIDPIPDKSRVETQIPIFLHVHKPPSGYHSIHLPGYTISKPKFQQRPPHEPDSGTLELTVLLVCTSAMHNKEGALERAFERAANDEIPERKTEPDGPVDVDEDDPERPLNGGPVAICTGCIVRERKRAARKKTKKVEEEVEWAKDEAKRMIVFNCPEIKDFMVAGTKETPVKDHSGTVDEMYVHAPMRIGCYCRHQNEKTGYQVIFTLRSHTGKILGQAISPSIMITDDHKQPPPNPPNTSYLPQQIPDQSMFFPNQGYGSFGANQPFGSGQASSDLPFRPSFSVPNLSAMGRQYASYGGLPRQFSSTALSNQDASNTVTPRMISRPHSPEQPVGQPGNKKRRSAGPGHNRLPSGLSMTRLDTSRSPINGRAPMTAGATSAAFNFGSPNSTDVSGTVLNDSLSHAQNLRNQAAIPSAYHHGPSGPTTPLFSTHSRAAMTPNDQDFAQYYSAQTSMHHSRAPSPTTRYAQFAAQQNASQTLNHHSSQGNMEETVDIPAQAAAALSALPPGFNLQRPPIIQRLIPDSGPPCGGSECTILGSGFFQGLEVMFGDTPASNTIFWGDTTLVCRAPPSCLTANLGIGMVSVVFRHQHPGIERNVANVPALMPTRAINFTYDHEIPKSQQPPTPGRIGATAAPASANRPNKKKSKSGAGSPLPPGMHRGPSMQNLSNGLLNLGGDGAGGMDMSSGLQQTQARGYFGQAQNQQPKLGNSAFMNPANAARIPVNANAGASASAGAQARGNGNGNPNGARRVVSGDIKGGFRG